MARRWWQVRARLSCLWRRLWGGRGGRRTRRPRVGIPRRRAGGDGRAHARGAACPRARAPAAAPPTSAAAARSSPEPTTTASRPSSSPP